MPLLQAGVVPNGEIKRCENCGGHMQYDVSILGRISRMPVACQCRMEAYKKEQEADLRDEARRQLAKYKKYSLMDEHFETSTFANWDIRPENRNYYDLGRAYCENWPKMLAENYGCLFYGKAGTGKTYLAFAIANELYERGVAVLTISVSRILKILKDSFEREDSESEVETLKALDYAHLLILDDLGVEYKTAWGYEKLYSIIDSRYRTKKPLIITTNLDAGTNELQENLAIIDQRKGGYDYAHRINSRITEMCTKIPIESSNWRVSKGAVKRHGLLSILGTYLPGK